MEKTSCKKLCYFVWISEFYTQCKSDIGKDREIYALIHCNFNCHSVGVECSTQFRSRFKS